MPKVPNWQTMTEDDHAGTEKMPRRIEWDDAE